MKIKRGGDNMTRQSFRIVMKTPIGERCGTMTAEWENKDGKLRGIMEILEHTNVFYGQIDETGNCRIEGEMVSLMRSIPYVAVGTISSLGLTLSLQEGRNTFEVVGVPYAEEGDTEF